MIRKIDGVDSLRDHKKVGQNGHNERNRLRRRRIPEVGAGKWQPYRLRSRMLRETGYSGHAQGHPQAWWGSTEILITVLVGRYSGYASESIRRRARAMFTCFWSRARDTRRLRRSGHPARASGVTVSPLKCPTLSLLHTLYSRYPPCMTG